MSAILLSAALLIDPQFSTAATASENLVFEVRSKFAGKRVKDLGALRAHDVHRHSRLLSAIDIPLGGDSQPESIGFESPFTRTFYTSLKSDSELHQETSMFKLIQEVISYG